MACTEPCPVYALDQDSGPYYADENGKIKVTVINMIDAGKLSRDLLKMQNDAKFYKTSVFHRTL